MNKFIIIAFFMLIAVKSYSQNFYGGALAGFSASQIDGDYFRGFHKVGLVAGAWTQIDLSEAVYWGMEVKLTQKGSHKRPSKKDLFQFVYHMNYIDLPVIVGYQYSPTVSAFTGLSFNYLLNRWGKDNFGPVDINNDNNIVPWEIGGLMGVKVNFDQLVTASWAKNATLDVRFQYSMLSVRYPHRFFIGNKYYGQFNNLISTTLYYKIDLGKN